MDSQYIGRQDADHAGESASQLLMFSFGFSVLLGVAGVAWPSFIARVFSAAVITFLCFREKNGVENGVFQLVKVALSSIVALFGTYQIAANGVAQSIWSLAALSGVAMGPVFITVIGQCMGNGNTEAAEHYFRKLIKLTLLISTAWNFLVFILTPVFLHFYSLSPETKRLVVWLVLIIMCSMLPSILIPGRSATVFARRGMRNLPCMCRLFPRLQYVCFCHICWGSPCRWAWLGLPLPWYVIGWSGLLCLFGGKEPESGKLFR